MSGVNFAGDILLKYDTENECADIVLDNGTLQDCGDLSTAIYLSLFGGQDKSSDCEWWGNSMNGTKKSEVLISEAEKIATGAPLTSASIKKMQAAASHDLKWLVSDGHADEVLVEVYAKDNKRVQIDVKVLKNGEAIFSNGYQSSWAGSVA